MESPIPFINATTIGSVTDETTFPAVWESILRTLVTLFLVLTVEKLILFLHLFRSNAAAAQIAAAKGHRGGSIFSIIELFRNRRSGASPHSYPRRVTLSVAFLVGVILYQAADFTVSAFVQQKGDKQIEVDTLPVKLWRVSNDEVHANYGCINKDFTYRDGQSDLALGLCHIFPIPTIKKEECIAITRRQEGGMYGIYHPRALKLLGVSFPGVVNMGPVLVTGNTQLYGTGTLPILQVNITRELVRNLFGDMVEGDVSVRKFDFQELLGSSHIGMALCGTLNVSMRRTVSKLVGGLGFVKGESFVLDPDGKQTSVLVNTSASRTSIYTVLFLGLGAVVGLVALFLAEMLWEWKYKRCADVSKITCTAISQACGTDCGMPAGVSNGNVHLERFNTIADGVLHLGVYPSDGPLAQRAGKGD